MNARQFATIRRFATRKIASFTALEQAGELRPGFVGERQVYEVLLRDLDFIAHPRNTGVDWIQEDLESILDEMADKNEISHRVSTDPGKKPDLRYRAHGRYCARLDIFEVVKRVKGAN